MPVHVLILMKIKNMIVYSCWVPN